MAQELTLIHAGQEFHLAPVKVERAKLYGAVDRIVLDDDQQPCKVVQMDDTGTILIPRGGIALGIIDENLNWVEKSQLKVVDIQGVEVQQIPSSFNASIELTEKVSVECFLDHSITAVYELSGENMEALIQIIGEDIYQFSFNYRSSYETNPAFLLSNESGLFMLVGYDNEFQFVGLEQIAAIDVEEEAVEEDEFDMDFSF